MNTILKPQSTDKKETSMKTQTVGYKAKAFEARNLAFFFLMALGIPLLGYGPFLFGILEEPSERGIGLNILFFIFNSSPTIAALVITGITEGKPGLKDLWKRFWNRDLTFKWLLVILLFNPAVRFTANLISRAAGGEAYPWIEPNIIPSLLFGLVVGLREEFGWRGYALPRLQARWSALTSSIILGVIWSFYDLGHWSPPYYWEFPLYTILLTIVFTWIFNNTNGSILAVVLFHGIVTNGLIGCCGVTWAVELLIGIYLLAVILIVVIFGPKNLVRSKPEPAGFPTTSKVVRDEQQTSKVVE
jgi:uncharacterized protein